MTTYTPASASGPGPIVTMAAGDETDVAAGVTLSSSTNPTITDPSYGTVKIDGQVFTSLGYGLSTVYLGGGGTGPGVSEVDVGPTGTVSGNAQYGHAVVDIGSGNFLVNNQGTISSSFFNIQQSYTSQSAVSVTGTGTVNNSGTISSAYGTGIYVADPIANSTTTVNNTGTVNSSGYPTYFGIYVEEDGSGQSSSINNYGQITQVAQGIAVTPNGNTATIYNYGTIKTSSAQSNASYSVSTDGPGHVALINYGTISGFLSAVYGQFDFVENAGTMTGAINLDGGGLFDSTYGLVYAYGQVNGTISRDTASGDTSTTIAGINGGTILGGQGNDIEIANQSQAAANNASHFILNGNSIYAGSGSGGNNALYGGGAFNTFDAGDLLGGTNQIWGGASLMSGVAGYTNNTLDFSATPAGESIYVDLLNGHNAYVNSNATNTGTYTFEDSIANVPNVIGSSGRDVIQADNGSDRIQGGAGADLLYAGSGQDTFAYTAYGDSNLVNGYDSVAGFKTGIDKLDLSALATNSSHLVIHSGANSTSLYFEQAPGAFNSSTDLAISFTGANAIKASDVIL